MNYTGFQFGYPDQALPKNVKQDAQWLDASWSVLQRMTALVALLILSPMVFFMFLAVTLSSKGGFLFAQERPGLNGRHFKVYKIRTMRSGTEKSTALGVSIRDPKVTRIGKVLRTLKLDELPQLWNIVNGDMAFVGPRPIPVALNQELSEKIPGFEQRYQIKPGLTSLGQICVKDNALGDALVEDWKLRFQGELHYIANRCIRYDLLMISMTILFVLRSLIRR